MTIDYSQLASFGEIDAESDKLLTVGFVETEAYARVEQMERIVVLGRKGTGKTAIYRALLDRASGLSDVFAIGLDFRAYPWGAHDEVKDTAAAPVERYMNSWIFLILVELAKLVLENQTYVMPNSDEARARKALETFINNNWGSSGFEFRDIFSRSIYVLQVEPRFAGSQVGSLRRETIARNQLASKIYDANRWLKECLEFAIPPESSYYILFDQLETAYDPADEEYRSRLIGLILAAREVFNWAQENLLNVAPIVFLRKDIYRELSFHEKSKVTNRLVETLAWTDALQGESSLKALIDARIRAITQTDASDPWFDVFDGNVMRGTQHKAKHLAARTYLRPRDIIKFCNLCLTEARRNQHDRITNDDIILARSPYSDYLVGELDDEIYTADEHWQKLLDVLRRIHTMRFTRDEFDEAFDEINTSRFGFDVTSALELLYRYGIIGFTRIGGGAGGSSVAFSYRDTAMSFDPTATAFTVHLGLKEHLDLIEAGDPS